MKPAAPRPGITSFTSFYPSFQRWSRRCTRRRTGRGTPAEFYKMRHMRYIIIQCELPRYSKRGRSLAFSPSASKRIRTRPATKSRKSFIIRELLAPRCSDHLPRVRTLVASPVSLHHVWISSPCVSFYLSLPFSFLSLQFSFFGSQASFSSARPREIAARTRAPQRPRFLTRRPENEIPRVFIFGLLHPAVADNSLHARVFSFLFARLEKITISLYRRNLNRDVQSSNIRDKLLRYPLCLVAL